MNTVDPLTYVIVEKHGYIEEYIGFIMVCDGDYLLQPSGVPFASKYSYLKTSVNIDIYKKPKTFRYITGGTKIEKNDLILMAHYIYFLYKDNGATMRMYQYILSSYYVGFISPLPFKQFHTSLKSLDAITNENTESALYFVMNDDTYTTTIDKRVLNVDHCYFMTFIYAWIYQKTGYNIVPKAKVTNRKKTNSLYTINGTHFWFSGNAIYYALHYYLADDYGIQTITNFTQCFDYSVELTSIYYLTYDDTIRNMYNNADHFIDCMKYMFANHLVADADYDSYKEKADLTFKYDLTYR